MMETATQPGPPSRFASAGSPMSRMVTVIEPRPSWRAVDFAELWRHRDLFRFLVWRDIRVLYAQSALGVGWAIAQPLATMLVLAIVFGYFGNVASDGVPYPLFSMAALVPWTFFSTGLISGVGSLVNESNMLRKIYFPRLLLPVASVIAKLMNFGIALAILLPLMVFFGVWPSWRFVALPVFIVLMVVATAGIALWLTALAVQYRDVRHAITFLTQLLMYASPVIYSTSIIPDRFQPIYALNPMVGVIEGFRWCVVGPPEAPEHALANQSLAQGFPVQSLAIGSLVAAALLISGMFYFRKRERLFADVA